MLSRTRIYSACFRNAARIVSLAAGTLALVSVPTALAQQYPVKPVRIIVGFPPGGAMDIVARTIGPQLSHAMGQPFVVDNRPGASSIIGADLAAKSTPDAGVVAAFLRGRRRSGRLGTRGVCGHHS